MIITDLAYVDADNLSIKESLKRTFNSEYLVYTSHWKWWSKTTLSWSIPLLIAGVFIFIVMIYNLLTSSNKMDFSMIVGMTFIPLIFCIPFVWALTYYYSFIAPKKIDRNINKFVRTYIPDATNLARFDTTNYTFQRGELQYELCYGNIPERNAKGQVQRKVTYFIICLYYGPKPGTEKQSFDENGHIKEACAKAIFDYLKSKGNISRFNLTDYGMFAIFPKKGDRSADEVTKALDELEYLLTRFSMKPLELKISPKE